MRYCSIALSEVMFHKESDRALDTIYEKFEELLEQVDLEDGDVELSQGVLTLKLGGLGTYVINKQTPNRQIWLSSPIRYVEYICKIVLSRCWPSYITMQTRDIYKGAGQAKTAPNKQLQKMSTMSLQQ